MGGKRQEGGGLSSVRRRAPVEVPEHEAAPPHDHQVVAACRLAGGAYDWGRMGTRRCGGRPVETHCRLWWRSLRTSGGLGRDSSEWGGGGSQIGREILGVPKMKKWNRRRGRGGRPPPLLLFLEFPNAQKNLWGGGWIENSRGTTIDR